MSAPGYRSAELCLYLSQTKVGIVALGANKKEHPKLFKTSCARRVSVYYKRLVG